MEPKYKFTGGNQITTRYEDIQLLKIDDKVAPSQFVPVEGEKEDFAEALHDDKMEESLRYCLSVGTLREIADEYLTQRQDVHIILNSNLTDRHMLIRKMAGFVPMSGNRNDSDDRPIQVEKDRRAKS